LSDDNTRLAIAAILETVMAMQAHQAQVFERLDRMDANLVAAKDLAPMLDIILGRLIEDRERQAEDLSEQPSWLRSRTLPHLAIPPRCLMKSRTSPC
jgi:hypothetical protein